MGGGQAETGRWARGREKEEFRRGISAGSVLWVSVWECFVVAVGQNEGKMMPGRSRERTGIFSLPPSSPKSHCPQQCGMGTWTAGALACHPLTERGSVVVVWSVCCEVTCAFLLPFSCPPVSPEADFIGRYCKMKINGTALGSASRCPGEGNNVVSGHQKELRDVQPESRDLLAGSQGRFD